MVAISSRVISIHAPREGSDPPFRAGRLGGPRISIHAPREGSDIREGMLTLEANLISIHAPREGSDSKHIQNAAGHFG